VEYDGSDDGLFSFRRRNKQKQWMVFTRGIVDQLLSFIISSRSTYTAATRHLANTIACFRSRRQDVVKLGTAAARAISIPPESARCPICGPNPAFIVIDAQSIGCTDTDNVRPLRPTENCPVLPIDASKLCILHNAALRVAVDKVLSSSKPLTPTQEQHLREWDGTRTTNARPSVEAAAANVFFRFFPLGSSSPVDASGAVKDEVVVKDGVGDDASSGSSEAGDSDGASARARKARRVQRGDRGLEASLRQDEDGNLVLGKKGKRVKLPAETWRDRVGICAPNFASHARDDDGAWLCIRPFLKAMLAETATGMFQSYDEEAVRLLGDSLRFQDPEKWRDVTKAVDGVGFVASFIGMLDEEMEAEEPFRLAIGLLLRRAVDVEKIVDDEFKAEAASLKVLQKGWKNGAYCRQWGGKPSPAEFAAWKDNNPEYNKADIDDPHVSYEFFPSLPRVRPALKDSVAAGRRAKYRGKKRHAADMEGDGDACNKAFSITAGLTQGVFNVVCPHVITLGFRVLFRAESVGEALSIVLERFPSLPAVIFYDVACKIDKNAMRRVRPVMRAHGVRCTLDRPHSITHSCSPIYMPDHSLGATAGVATQAAEVSHSISVGNRTSLAYMAPATYITHRIVQVAFMNIRKLYRLHADNLSGENDHIPLAPFFHQHVSSGCQRGSACACEALPAGQAEDVLDVQASKKQVSVTSLVSGPAAATTSPADATPPGRSLPVPAHSGEEAIAGTQDARAVHSGGRLAPTTTVSSAPDDAVELSSDCESDDGDICVQELAQLDAPLLDGVDELLSADHARSPLTQEHQAFLDVLSAAERAGAEQVRPCNKANIVLTVADYRAMRDDQWLNDAVMNSYVKLLNVRDDLERASHAAASLSARSLPIPPFSGTRIMNTFFFDRLWSRQHGYDYVGVSRWARKAGVDLKSIGQVIIPVNLDRVHWVMIVVDLHRREFVFCDPYGAGDRRGTVQHVRQWLSDEAEQQLGPDVVAEWAVDDWDVVIAVDLPKQVDSSSCGVFTLLAASFFAARTTCKHTQADMADLRRRLAIDLFLDDIVWTAVDVIPV